MVGIGVGGGSRRSGEEEAGGIGRRQHQVVVCVFVHSNHVITVYICVGSLSVRMCEEERRKKLAVQQYSFFPTSSFSLRFQKSCAVRGVNVS
jgi:hypothetical protein